MVRLLVKNFEDNLKAFQIAMNCTSLDSLVPIGPEFTSNTIYNPAK